MKSKLELFFIRERRNARARVRRANIRAATPVDRWAHMGRGSYSLNGNTQGWLGRRAAQQHSRRYGRRAVFE